MMRRKSGFSGERAIVLPQMVINMEETDPLCSALHITDIGFYPKARGHYRERKEPIDTFLLIYCTDGRGHYRVNGGEYEIKANQYFILPAGVPHVYKADDKDPWTIYWVHFKGTLAPYYAVNTVLPTDVRPQINSRISVRISLFEEIYSTLHDGYSIDNLRFATSLLHHFLGSLRYIEQYRKANTNIKEEDIIHESIHYMKENIEKRLSVQTLSDYIGYSPSHFSALFKQKIGYAPLTYFNLLKIQKACCLLNETNMKLNQICHKVGMDDAYYFSRKFKQIMKTSPSDYRTTKKT